MQKNRFNLCGLLLLGLGLSGMQAQESINATGGNATGDGGSVSYSVGQVFYTTSSDSGHSVAQGVQQAFEISVLGVEDIDVLDIQLAIYPNPTQNFLQLVVKQENLSDLNFQIYDAQGRLLSSKEINDLQTKINMSQFPSATYFIKVNNDRKHIKTFKILKK